MATMANGRVSPIHVLLDHMDLSLTQASDRTTHQQACRVLTSTKDKISCPSLTPMMDSFSCMYLFYTIKLVFEP